MTVYSGPVFDMAVNQFGVIANHLSIPMDERDRLLLPKRAITISCPIHRDDGTVAVFEGYRVQHHLTLGPTKGGTRFAPSVDIGSYAAFELHRFGLKVIAVSDHTGALYNKAGLDIPALMRHTGVHGSIAGFSNQLQFDPAQILTLPCDVLVPAAMERVIDAQVAENLKCRVLAEGANGPTTPDADLVLEKRQSEIFLIPDILCNSGGV